MIHGLLHKDVESAVSPSSWSKLSFFLIFFPDHIHPFLFCIVIQSSMLNRTLLCCFVMFVFVWFRPSCLGLISPACKFCFWSNAACWVMVLLSPVLSFQLPQFHPIVPPRLKKKMKTNENVCFFFHSKTSLCLYFRLLVLHSLSLPFLNIFKVNISSFKNF